MPYTQATPLDQSVRDALDRKVTLLKNRVNSSKSDPALYYYTNRTPWIRMVSAVDIVGTAEQQELGAKGSDLAKDYVLTSGYEESNLPSGHSSTSLGIRPRPGIQNLHIVSHNQFGSLRTGTVNFQVWSKEDLDACEILYMRPGMSVLLEWGWSLYLSGDNDNLRVNEMGKGYDIFNTNKTTLIDILADLGERKKEYGHGYDAIFGFVKNFSWSIRPDGGYDCKTDIVSPGELIESLNIAQPVGDRDARDYNDYKKRILKKKAAELDSQIRNVEVTTWDKIEAYLAFISPGSPGGGFYYKDGEFTTFGMELIEAQELLRENLVAELNAVVEDVPSYETQTALATFFEVDLNLVARSVIDSKLQEDPQTTEPLDIKLADLDLTSIKEGNRYTERLFGTNSNTLEKFKHLRLVNWVSQELQKDDDGKIYIDPTTGDSKVVTSSHRQLYIKYGLLLEVLNRFMLHNDDSPIISFDISGVSTYNNKASDFLSLDPSACILPTDMAFMEANHRVRYITADEGDPILPNAPGPSQAISDSTSVTDIYLNIEMVDELISSSRLKTFSADGVPQLFMFNFVESVNDRINQACAGVMELSIQYFEDEGKYAIIDRVNFNDVTKETENYKIALLGKESILNSISVSSQLTPSMASALAISVQTDFKAHNNTEAGFLRFNYGIRDRVLKNRNTTGTFSNTSPKEDFTVTGEDLSRVEELYNLMYGNVRWMPASFEYAREIHHKYVTEVLGRGTDEIPTNGRTVVPFVTTLNLDGTSGVKILNSLLLDSNLLPYSYAKIKGGVGVVITGIEASVDATGWQTILKAQYYARKSGNIEGVRAKVLARQSEEDQPLTDHILFDFADIAEEQDFTKYQNQYGILQQDANGNSKFLGLNTFIEEHFDKYWDGVYEAQEYANASTKGHKSALESYWEGAGWIFNPINIESDEPGEATPKTAWSSVYVSYIMNNFANSKDQRFRPSAFPYKTAHWQYVKSALDNLKAEANNSWVAIPLTKYGGLVKAEVGDVLVAARDTTNKAMKRYASHGTIVRNVTYSGATATAFLADGNNSNTNSITDTLELSVVTREDRRYGTMKLAVYPKAEKELGDYVIVLKYYGNI